MSIYGRLMDDLSGDISEFLDEITGGDGPGPVPAPMPVPAPVPVPAPAPLSAPVRSAKSAEDDPRLTGPQRISSVQKGAQNTAEGDVRPLTDIRIDLRTIREKDIRSSAINRSADAECERPRRAVHMSKLKQCSLGLEAITLMVTRVPHLKHIVYAGAAPGQHVLFLAEAFPSLEFHLYDPAPFLLREKADLDPEYAAVADRIHINATPFTEALAIEWAERSRETAFVCDVRSGGDYQEEFELEIGNNMRRQHVWWEKMRPAAALLRIRFPDRGPPTVEYPEGMILTRPFGPPGAAEANLLIWQGSRLVEYDPRWFRDAMTFVNTTLRETVLYDHKIPPGYIRGLCRCFDCARLVAAVETYVAFRPLSGAGRESSIAYLVGRMVAAVGESVCIPHGENAAPPPAQGQTGGINGPRPPEPSPRTKKALPALSLSLAPSRRQGPDQE